jgi:hypothetical protein
MVKEADTILSKYSHKNKKLKKISKNFSMRKIDMQYIERIWEAGLM